MRGSEKATRETTAREGKSTASARVGRDENARGFSMESLSRPGDTFTTLTRDADVTQRDVVALSAHVSSAARCTDRYEERRLGF